MRPVIQIDAREGAPNTRRLIDLACVRVEHVLQQRRGCARDFRIGDRGIAVHSFIMAASRVDHYSASIDNRVGEAARVLGAFRDSGINFTALWAYPSGKKKAQLEMIPEPSAGFKTAAKKAGLALSPKQTAFFVNGEDHAGVVAESLSKLAEAGINVGAVQAVCGGSGRYGAVIFLAQADVRKAAKVLGI